MAANHRKKGDQVPEFSSETWTYIVVGLVAFFALGVFARVRNLMRISKDIESKLDYSKMKEWEEEDDDWGKPPRSSMDDGSSTDDRSPTDQERSPTDRRDSRK